MPLDVQDVADVIVQIYEMQTDLSRSVRLTMLCSIDDPGVSCRGAMP